MSSFFSMSDIGLNSVTANTFAIDYASGDRIKCQKLILNNFVLVFIFLLIISCYNRNNDYEIKNLILEVDLNINSDSFSFGNQAKYMPFITTNSLVSNYYQNKLFL